MGDAYDATRRGGLQPVPHPDPNPLDCDGHGTHVAGIAAGFRRDRDRQQYTGAYDAKTITTTTGPIGPGVAPKADLYAVRVFGCTGSTDVVVDAIEWAVDNDMDVINMSLGSPFGGADESRRRGRDQRRQGRRHGGRLCRQRRPNAYMVGSPAVTDGAIIRRGERPDRRLRPGASDHVAGPARTSTAINANGDAFPGRRP